MTKFIGKEQIMSLPSTIDIAFVNQYQSMLYILSQQQKSKFASKVRNEQVHGESKAFDRLGEAEVEEITTRHPDTPNNEQPHSRRWVTPSNYHTNSYIDKQDQVKLLINPQNQYAQNQARALGRQTDDLIITAALGTAATGNTPTSSTVAFADESISINGDGTTTSLGTLASVQVVADISIAKIETMLRIFHDEDVDEEIPLYWAISPKSVEDLLQLTQIGSFDYNTVKALAEGKVERFSGFQFFWTTRLTQDAATSTAYRSIAWAQDGIIWGSSFGVESRIDERKDKSYITQVYSRMNGNSVRMDGDKVHECLNQVA
jgi:hypothetical protein